MKKMISCLAALAMLTSMLSFSTALAADNDPIAPVSAAKETSELSVKDIAGEWKYQKASGNYDVSVQAETVASVIIKEDGTFAYSYLDQNREKIGTVKLDYEDYSDGTKLPIFLFYDSDNKLLAGGYPSSDDQDILHVGNGGMAWLVRGNVAKSCNEIAAEKMNYLSSILAILGGGAADEAKGTVTLNGKKYVKLAKTSFTKLADLEAFIQKTTTGGLCKKLITECEDKIIEQDGALYIDFTPHAYYTFPTQKGAVINSYNEKSFTATTVDDDKLYGYGRAEFALINNEEWHISSYDFGEFNEASNTETAVAKMNDLNKIFSVLSNGASDEVEEAITQDGERYGRYFFSDFDSLDEFKKFIAETCTGKLKDKALAITDSQFIEKDGKLYARYVVRGSVQFQTAKGVKITSASGTSFTAVTIDHDDLNGYGKADLEFVDGKWYVSDFGFGDYGELSDEDLKDRAVSKMNDLNTILTAFAEGADNKNTITINGVQYGRYTNSKFASVDEFKTFISQTCSGELRDKLLADTDTHFIVKDGKVYAPTGAKGTYLFRTDKSVELSNKADGLFTATTVEHDDLYGFGRAHLILENGKWYIYNYEFGDFVKPAETATTAASTTSTTTTTTTAATTSASTASSTSTSASTSASTAAPETTAASTASSKSGSKFSLIELTNMALSDYENRTGSVPASFDASETAGGIAVITLKDSENNVLDVYTIDMQTGMAAAQSGFVTELPQTGNNSLKAVGAASAALALTFFGAIAAAKSGVLRRKEDEE